MIEFTPLRHLPCQAAEQQLSPVRSPCSFLLGSRGGASSSLIRLPHRAGFRAPISRFRHSPSQPHSTSSTLHWHRASGTRSAARFPTRPPAITCLWASLSAMRSYRGRRAFRSRNTWPRAECGSGMTPQPCCWMPTATTCATSRQELKLPSGACRRRRVGSRHWQRTRCASETSESDGGCREGGAA